jgi:alginate O-acetyltransferase complex protein AlgI
MSLNSPLFLFAFLPVTITAHWLLPSRLRNPLLLTASLAFYLFGDQAHFFILLLAITVNYLVAWPLARATGGRRRLLLALAVWFDLALLGLAKYGGWLADHGVLNERLVISRSLPLGISFFIFAMLSYLFDIRRGHAAVERSLPRFTLFVTLFPKLVAGPIARYRDLAGQLGVRRFSLPLFATGVQRFVLGLGKKLLIANTLAPIVDEIFALPRAGLTPALAWLGAVSYGLQIYFDFSGYSDMAVGLSLCLGVQLPLNFRSPYKSTNIIEFWRRWHISLSTFLRDYLYIPLGGSRKGPGRRYVNLFMTMLLGGLWHGAAWTFVIWGALHGAFLVVNHLWISKVRHGKPYGGRLASVLGWLLTFVCVMVAWVVFRAESMNAAMEIYKGMLGMHGAPVSAFSEFVVPFRKPEFFHTLLLGMLICLALPQTITLDRWIPLPRAVAHRAVLARIAPALTALGTVILLGLCVSRLGTYSPFLYFQF